MSTDGTVARLHRTTTHPNNKLHEYHYFEFLLLNYTHFKHVVFHNNLFRARTYFQFWVENWRTDAKEKKKCCYYIKQNKLPRWKRRQNRDKWFFPFRFNSILQNRQANGTPECVTEISPTEINANGWWCLCESVMRIGDAINKWNWWKTKKKWKTRTRCNALHASSLSIRGKLTPRARRTKHSAAGRRKTSLKTFLFLFRYRRRWPFNSFHFL